MPKRKKAEADDSRELVWDDIVQLLSDSPTEAELAEFGRVIHELEKDGYGFFRVKDSKIGRVSTKVREK